LSGLQSGSKVLLKFDALIERFPRRSRATRKDNAFQLSEYVFCSSLGYTFSRHELVSENLYPSGFIDREYVFDVKVDKQLTPKFFEDRCSNNLERSVLWEFVLALD